MNLGIIADQLPPWYIRTILVILSCNSKYLEWLINQPQVDQIYQRRGGGWIQNRCFPGSSTPDTSIIKVISQIESS